MEGDYLLDYALFTGVVREYIVRSLEAEYSGNKNDWHQRLLLIAIYREEYTAYEDLGAFLDAFLANAADDSVLPIHRVLNYTPARVRLKTLLKEHGVDTPNKLYAKLKLDEWIPTDWKSVYPEIDLLKVLRTACAFFVQDCAENQKDYGVVGFNKIKHGLLVVPSAQRYHPRLPDVPGMLFPTVDKTASASDPFTMQAVPYSDDKIEQRARVVHFIQVNLRLIAFLHVLRRWPATLKARGYNPPITGFSHLHLTDVRNVAGQMTRDGKLDWPETD